MEKIAIELEYQKIFLEMINREWSFMYDVIKTTFSSLLITIPIYLSIIGFLLSYTNIKLSYYLGWIIGCCLGVLVAILFIVYYNFVIFVAERLQLSKEFNINEFMRRANERLKAAKERLKEAIILYGVTHATFIAMIIAINLMI